MNKRHTRLFALASTAVAALIFLVMTVDTHRQFPALTNTDQLTEEVVRGQNIWHASNCINCHTMLGEGAYYAPDLTKITQLRGTPYLTAFLKDPSQFYNEKHHRRLMPNPNLADDEISDLIAFMTWVSNVDNQGWPPRPLLVSGRTIIDRDLPTVEQAKTDTDASGQVVSTGKDPIALGETVFQSASPTCVACHSTSPGVDLAGPSLAGLNARAEQIIQSADYKGKASTPEEFIHESIVEPSAYLHPGAMYSANGVSFMPTNYVDDLTPEQIDHLVAYLASFK